MKKVSIKEIGKSVYNMYAQYAEQVRLEKDVDSDGDTFSWNVRTLTVYDGDGGFVQLKSDGCETIRVELIQGTNWMEFRSPDELRDLAILLERFADKVEKDWEE